MSVSTSKQRYVAGSFTALFFWGTDYYPDEDNPDDTDLSLLTTKKNIQFKLGDSGTVTTLAGVVTTRTVNGTAHQGILISAANAAATLATASNQWHWRFCVDLSGDSNPCYSSWQTFEVFS